MERKYESDLTPKEKRKLELEKLRGMTLGQKAEYLWTYYKWVLAAAAAFIFLIGLAVSIYSGIRTEQLLSVAVLDADAVEEDREKLEQDLLELLRTRDRYQSVMVDTSVQSGGDYAAAAKRVATIGSGEMDLLICSKEVYGSLEEQEVFRSWPSVLGEEYKTYEPYMENGRLNLAKSSRWQSYHLTSYEPVYAGVYAGSENEKNILRFLEYFFAS